METFFTSLGTDSNEFWRNLRSASFLSSIPKMRSVWKCFSKLIQITIESIFSTACFYIEKWSSRKRQVTNGTGRMFYCISVSMVLEVAKLVFNICIKCWWSFSRRLRNDSHSQYVSYLLCRVCDTRFCFPFFLLFLLFLSAIIFRTDANF